MSLSTRRIDGAFEGAGEPKAVDASPCHEQRNEGEPYRKLAHCEESDSDDTGKADDGRDDETARASDHEPQQRAKDLSAVERVDRQEVEEQQPEIDDGHRLQQSMKVR